MKKYSTEALIAFLYDECSTELSASIHKNINIDWALSEKLSVMKEAIERLSKMPLLSPPPQLIAEICSTVNDCKPAAFTKA